MAKRIKKVAVIQNARLFQATSPRPPCSIAYRFISQNLNFFCDPEI
jgi:hypothetical protein